MSGALDLTGYKLIFDDVLISFDWNGGSTPGYRIRQTNFFFGGRSLPSNGGQATDCDASIETNPLAIDATGTVALDNGPQQTLFGHGGDDVFLIGAHADPVADHVLQFVQAGSDINVVINPDGTDGQGVHRLVTLERVVASSFRICTLV